MNGGRLIFVHFLLLKAIYLLICSNPIYCVTMPRSTNIDYYFFQSNFPSSGQVAIINFEERESNKNDNFSAVSFVMKRKLARMHERKNFLSRNCWEIRLIMTTPVDDLVLLKIFHI